jgi:hypothetical protein
MQATGTLRDSSASKGVGLWLIALVAGMLLAGAGGYLAHGSSTAAGAPSQAQPTATSSANEAQFDGGLQR